MRARLRIGLWGAVLLHCLQFFHLLERGEIANPLDYDDVLDDIKEECGQHGFVETVHILKPIDEDKDGVKKHQPIDV